MRNAISRYPLNWNQSETANKKLELESICNKLVGTLSNERRYLASCSSLNGNLFQLENLKTKL